jgi:hypothetical protein
MNFDSLLNSAFNLVHQYSILAAATGVLLLFIAWKNPKATFKFVIFLLFLSAFFYAVSLFSGVTSLGSKNKDQMINQTGKQLE